MLLWLMMIGFSLMFLFIDIPPDNRGEPFPAAFVSIMMGFASFIYLCFGLPSIIAGIGLLKRKRWAKIWSIIAGVVSASSFPIGTAICVYTFWFLFSDPGKSLYDKDYVPLNYNPQRGLYDAPNFQDFSAREQTEQKREYDFTGKTQPPDWR